MYIYWFLSESS